MINQNSFFSNFENEITVKNEPTSPLLSYPPCLRANLGFFYQHNLKKLHNPLFLKNWTNFPAIKAKNWV